MTVICLVSQTRLQLEFIQELFKTNVSNILMKNIQFDSIHILLLCITTALLILGDHKYLSLLLLIITISLILHLESLKFNKQGKPLSVDEDDKIIKNNGYVSVADFGAVGDGETDSTIAFQQACIAAMKIGSVIIVPPSTKGYVLTSKIVIPQKCTLRGFNNGMRRGSVYGTRYGTILLIRFTGIAIEMSMNSTIEQIEFNYDVDLQSEIPEEYGSTIYIPDGSHGTTIRDIQCHLAYRFIDCHAECPTISNIQGYPMKYGITLHRVSDVPRISNIQFNPNVINGLLGTPIQKWVQNNGLAYVVKGAEEFFYSNIFCFGYNIGFLFPNKLPGEFTGVYGRVVNFGFDSCNYGIQTGSGGISGRGVSFTNGGIIPLKIGVHFQDTVHSNADEEPLILLTSVTVWNFAGYSAGIWLEQKSKAKILWNGGFLRDYEELIRHDSQNGFVNFQSVITNEGIQ